MYIGIVYKKIKDTTPTPRQHKQVYLLSSMKVPIVKGNSGVVFQFKSTILLHQATYHCGIYYTIHQKGSSLSSSLYLCFPTMYETATNAYIHTENFVCTESHAKQQC